MSKSEDKPAEPPKTFPRHTYSEMLTPEEIEALRQNDAENAEFGRKAFTHLRRKEEGERPASTLLSADPVQISDPDMLTPDELEVLWQVDRKTAELARKAFAHLRPKK